MRSVGWTLLLLLTLGFPAHGQSGETKDLHLEKLTARIREPSKKGRHRSKLKLTGRIASHQLPRDFEFHPLETPLTVQVGGVLVFGGGGEGTWSREGLKAWSYREKGERILKIRVDLAHGDFTFRGKRLDLCEAEGPVGCDVFLLMGDEVFGIRIDGQVKNERWQWVMPPGGNPSKAPGYTEPEDPGSGDPGGPTGPLAYRVLADGNTLQSPIPGMPWQDRLVVRDQGTLIQQWFTMFGNAMPPSVDFSREQVVLLYMRGNYFSVFNVIAEDGVAVIEYRNIASPGLRSYVYRAVAIPRMPGNVTFRPIF